MGTLATRPKHVGSDSFFVCSLDGKPVSVHLNVGVVAALEQDVSATLATADARVTEIGGLLLGRIRQASPDYYLVSVEDYELVECEHVRGASWILSKSDKELLARQLRRHARHAHKDALVIVGWFRTHTRPGLFLDQYDFNLFHDYFPHPAMVALVVRPAVEGVHHAGFFFWEGGDIHRARPYRIFPFDAGKLTPAQAPSGAQAAAPPMPVAASVDAPKPPAPKAPAPRVPAPKAPAGIAARVAAPRPPKPAMSAWKRPGAVVWVPVALGVLAGFLWQPNPFKEKSRNRGAAALEQAQQKSDRALFHTPSPDEAARPAAIEVDRPTSPDPLPPARAKAAKPPERKRLAIAQQSAPVRVQPQYEPPPAPVLTAAVNTTPLPRPRIEPAPLLATATIEPARVSGLRRAVGSIPGLGFLKKKKSQQQGEDFVPATPLRQVRPPSPRSLAEETPVRVKLFVAPNGHVLDVELLSKRVESSVAEIAMNAARRWEFRPARMNDKPVETEVVVQFRFEPVAAER